MEAPFSWEKYEAAEIYFVIRVNDGERFCLWEEVMLGESYCSTSLEAQK